MMVRKRSNSRSFLSEGGLWDGLRQINNNLLLHGLEGRHTGKLIGIRTPPVSPMRSASATQPDTKSNAL